jgi:hypothetical protein
MEARMRRLHFVLLLAAIVAAGCSGATADKDRADTLEKRVEELEKQLASHGISPKPTPTPSARPAGASAAPAAAAKASPKPVPTPTREPVVVPEGTELTLILETGVSSAVSQAGDEITARVERAVGPDGRVALPGGASVEGRVVDARPSGKVKGRARLVLAFDKIVVRGRAHPLAATNLTLEADPQRGKDAAVIGGGAALGGIIGAITGKKGGFGKGVLVGGAAGTGAVLLTKGKEVELPDGAHVAIQLREALRL